MHALGGRDPGPGPPGGRPLRLRRVPHRRRRAAGRDGRGRRGEHDPARAGDVRAAAARRGGPARGRRGARPRAALRRDGAQDPDRARPRRRAALRQRRLHRRHPRRAREHQRRLGRGDQDHATRRSSSTRCSTPGALRRRGREHEGADLQREGRGPPLPRPPERPPRRRAGGALPRARAAGRTVRERRDQGAAAAGRPERRARHGDPRPRRVVVLLDDRGLRRRASCCRSCSPTPRTSASSTRW